MALLLNLEDLKAITINLREDIISLEKEIYDACRNRI